VQLAILLVVLFLVMAVGPEVAERLSNGAIVGRTTTPDAEGIIWTPPLELAAAADVDVETYALARCLASEHAADPTPYLRAVGWAVKNKARERRVSLLVQLTDGAGERGDGYFGEQKAKAGTKYASTARDPHERHIEVAREIVYEAIPDFTGGATHFFSPRAQDQLAAKAAAGDERYAKYLGKDAAFIFASWSAKGLYPGGAVAVVPPGIDGNRLTLWRRA
jgi:hypothetical protein